MRANNPKYPVSVQFPFNEYHELKKEKDKMRMSWNQVIYEWMRFYRDNKKE